MRASRCLAALKAILLTSLLIVIASPVVGSTETWVRVFSGEENDIGWSMKAAPDGGFFVVGETTSYGAGGRDALLMKLDSQGDPVWSKTFGGSLSDAAFDLCITADGGCAVTGLSYNFNTAQGGGWATPWLLRLDGAGNVLWEKYYVRQAAAITYGISQTHDGGFILAGQWAANSDTAFVLFLMKVGAGGEVQWQHAYGGGGQEALTRVIETPDGGFAAAGYYWGGDWQHDFVEYLLKVDSTGQILWQKLFQDHNGYTVGNSTTTSDVINTQDGNLVFAGGNPAMLWKLDQQGNVLWEQRVSTLPGGLDTIALTAVVPASDGGYYGVGQETRCDASHSCIYGTLVVQVTETGELEWAKVYQADFRTPYATDACAIPGGGLAIVGATAGNMSGSDLVVMRVGPEGEFSDPCVVTLDSGLSWSMDPTAVQNATATIVDEPCSALPGAILPEPVSLDESGTICPVITSVRVLQNPFRLDIRGLGFVADSWVQINGVLVPGLNKKFGYQFIAKKGDPLKAMLPKGQTACITVNGNWGNYKSDCFAFKR
jgi:hypothetical protein